MSDNIEESSNQYEMQQLVTQLVNVLFNESLSHTEQNEKIADIFIELQSICGWSNEQMSEEIRSITTITPEEVLNTIRQMANQSFD